MNDCSRDTLQYKNLTLCKAEDILSLLPGGYKAQTHSLHHYFKSINAALGLESLALKFHVSLNTRYSVFLKLFLRKGGVTLYLSPYNSSHLIE